MQVVRLVQAVNRAFITHGLQPFYEVGWEAGVHYSAWIDWWQQQLTDRLLVL